MHIDKLSINIYGYLARLTSPWDKHRKIFRKCERLTLLLAYRLDVPRNCCKHVGKETMALQTCLCITAIGLNSGKPFSVNFALRKNTSVAYKMVSPFYMT